TGSLIDLARRSPSRDVAAAVVFALNSWRFRERFVTGKQQEIDRAIAEVYGATGIVVGWNTRGPVSAAHALQVIANSSSIAPMSDGSIWGRNGSADGNESHVVIARDHVAKDGLWFAYTDVAVGEPT